MKTKVRLFWLLGAMLLLVTTLAVVSLATIWRLRSEGMAVIKANYNSIAYMQTMLDAVDTEPDPQRRDAALNAQLRLQQANVTEPTEREATEQLALAVAGLGHTQGDTTGIAELRRAISAVLDLNRTAIVQKAAIQEQSTDRAVLWITLTGTFAFLIAFSLFMGMPHLIAEPIRRLTEGIDRIAAGHYGERVMLPRKDEFGHMATRFNSMAAELERWSTSNLSRIMAEKARAEAVINSLRDPSIGVDEEQRILFMNRQADELLGVAQHDLLGRSLTEAAANNDLLAHILGAKASTTFKAVLGGREQQFTVESSRIDAGEEHLGTVYTLYNVTPYLERDQAKTMFLATISHELKTPLASTDIGLGLLERQQATQLTADQGAIINDLRKDHQRLVRIVSELLDMAQVETGRVRVNVAQQPIATIVQEAVHAMQTTISARRIHMDLRLPDPEFAVMADADKATWSLINLLSNALRHAPADSTITIVGERADHDLLLSVADDGPGLSPEQEAHLFERFAPHAGSGTGLGLSIARELMRAMGGDITYRPGALSGAVFTLRFKSVGNG